MKSAVFVGRRLALAKYAHIRSGESEDGFSTASSFFSAISLLTACRGALMIPQLLSHLDEDGIAVRLRRSVQAHALND